MMLAVDVGERTVTTIEGLARGDDAASRAGGLHRARRDAMRLLHAGHGDELRRASRAQSHTVADDVKAAISGHLCRCGTYPHVVDAMLDARQGGKG